MKKSFRLLSLLFATALFPLTVRGAAGYLYESDNSTGKIFQFTTNSIGAVVKLEFATGLTGVRGLAFDHAANLFVGQTDTIIKITPSGFTTVFATGLDGPNFLAFGPNGDLFVSDRGGHILEITPQGNKGYFASGMNKPTGLAFDYAGNLFVADAGSNGLYQFTPSGEKSTVALGLNNPQGLAFDHNGYLHVVNNGTGTVEAFSVTGSKFTHFYNLQSPVGIAFDSAGNAFVAENCNGANRIIKFAAVGVNVGTVYAQNLGCPLQLAFEPARDPSLNISTRARVDDSPNRELIGGFIITGTAPKTVLIRALGPSLAASHVIEPLQDPTLELHTPDGVVTNDNWRDSTQKADIQATGAAPPDDRESALLVTLDPGPYTAIVRGKPPFQSGVALVDIYDLNVNADSTLANISSRGYVEDSQNVMIAGVIIGGGNGAGKILIRGLGPSLAQAGVHGVLPNPELVLNDANGNVVASNDDWATTQPYEIAGTGIPPQNSFESAIVITLKSGRYTAILQDSNGASGIGLVEIYNLR